MDWVCPFMGRLCGVITPVCAESRRPHNYESRPQLPGPERQLREARLRVSFRPGNASLENFPPLSPLETTSPSLSCMLSIFLLDCQLLGSFLPPLRSLWFRFLCRHCTSSSSPVAQHSLGVTFCRSCFPSLHQALQGG